MRSEWSISIRRTCAVTVFASETYRIYMELDMQLRSETPRRRVKARLREDRADALGPNDVWPMDLVHDRLTTGRKIQELTVVDTYSRYLPVLDPRFSCRDQDVVAALERARSRI